MGLQGNKAWACRERLGLQRRLRPAEGEGLGLQRKKAWACREGFILQGRKAWACREGRLGPAGKEGLGLQRRLQLQHRFQAWPRQATQVRHGMCPQVCMYIRYNRSLSVLSHCVQHLQALESTPEKGVQGRLWTSTLTEPVKLQIYFKSRNEVLGGLLSLTHIAGHVCRAGARASMVCRSLSRTRGTFAALK